MYTKMIAYKNFQGKPQNRLVQFNLEVREVFPLLKEFQQIFTWQESIKSKETRTLTTEEVMEFYNAFETVLLASWGELSDDGELFKKAGRYEFEESKLFAACMEMFVSDPPETGKLLDGIMPSEMANIARKAEGNLDKLAENPETPEQVRAQIRELQAKLGDDSTE